ncbi:hypothetical protein BgAZ_103990 [Babesia gibsoni]|uniref:Uncharacterized protein n=1 Tax=Babesia gibsoni TaxID=33632 RepID=A0AAD8UVB9_BABGI|nr:hypothetical protein BgAZ_103990 [Babesia gibsoni]
MRAWRIVTCRCISTERQVSPLKGAAVLQNVDDMHVTPFIKQFSERLSLSSYKIIEDDFRRLARSSKVPFIALGTFLIVPGTFALVTTPSAVVDELIHHQFMLSSSTLSWMSSSTLLFHILRFNTSIAGISVSLFGLIGSSLSLIIGDYSANCGYACLLITQTAFALTNSPYRIAAFKRFGSTHRSWRTLFPLAIRCPPILPVCVAKPLFFMSSLNIALTILMALRRLYVKNDLSTTSHEDFIRRYEEKNPVNSKYNG